MTDTILWQPDLNRMRETQLWAFGEATEALHGTTPDDYAGVLAWSIADPEGFYSALWDFSGLVGKKGGVAVQPADDLRQVRFFPEARINYAENCLKEPDERLALICHRDDGTRRTLTRKGLYDLVSQLVQALRAEGVGPGDRVAAIVTNDIESIASYLAVSALGAIWASCSPDFGPASASDRLAQVAPKLLLAVPSYRYGEKLIDIAASIDAVAEAADVQRVVLFGAPTQASYSRPHVALGDWLAPFKPQTIAFHRGGFADPMVILFSSGTTGKPKCIMHSGGGLLLQHIKEQRLHADLREGDRFFYYTTCGWMMWNWLVTGLASGATLVTCDGNPFHPHAGYLVDLIDLEGISIFGTSAKYIDALAKAGLKPRESHRLDTLRSVLSTGSPLLPASFDYIYADWKADVHLASISGGTDICACFLGGVPVWPVRRGELQGPQLGMDLDTLDENGSPVEGVPGELVCRNAHVSMPVGFWGDDDGSRYAAAYFERFPGVWAHGDFAEKRSGGGYVIHGRSDTTLNPGGVRIGTAEIYRQVETVPEVREAIAVGQDWDGDQRVVLFVVMQPGQALTEAVEKTIRSRIRAGATPRHVPAKIVAVADIPRTRSGKISEVAVRDAIHGRPGKNDAALANPECLAVYRGLEALRT